MLTNENYFSPEMNMKYMGSSQFKSFCECESRAMAELRGDFEREKSVSMLVGSFVDSHFEKTMDLFKGKNPEIFTKSGDLKSNFRQAEYIIERLERDEVFMKYMSGQTQVIRTGEIDGVPFKIKIDSFHSGKAIVDLKVVKDFQGMWKNGLKLNFINYWMYDLQMAIYQAVEGNNLPTIIAGVTKEKEPDIGLFEIPQERLEQCLNMVKSQLPRIMEVKSGNAEAIRCESCDWCKRTKKLTGYVDFNELDNIG